MKKIFNERGFMLMSVIFLMMITSFAALILMNGTKKVVNQNSALRIIALHLAEEQFAEIESLAAQGKMSSVGSGFLGDSNDLKNFYDSNNEKNPDAKPIIFDIKTSISGSRVKVKVEWSLDDEEYFVELEKNVYTKN